MQLMATKKAQKDYGKTFSMRLYQADQARLEKLRDKMELQWHVIIRQALKAFAAKQGVA